MAVAACEAVTFSNSVTKRPTDPVTPGGSRDGPGSFLFPSFSPLHAAKDPWILRSSSCRLPHQYKSI